MIIAFPHKPGSGGPGSFQIRFEKILKEKGYGINYKKDNAKCDVVFIVGGTSKIFWLLQMKLKGIPIVYRLDGLNWLHRKTKVGVQKYLISEYRNWNNQLIHAFLSDFVIYQSKFVEDWWLKKGWRNRKNTTIIHNGVEIEELKTKTEFKNSILVLEGTIDYSPYAVQLLNELADKLPDTLQIDLYGKFEDPLQKEALSKKVNYHGFLDREQVAEVMKGSIYLSLDINPACPNTVIEALSNSAPVVAFNTGAIPELIDNSCGAVVDYGSNPWELAYPDVKAMFADILEVAEDYQSKSMNARFKAEKEYNNYDIVDKYLKVIGQMK